MTRRSNVRNIAILLGLFFVLIETVCYFGGRFLQAKGVVYRPVVGDYAAYLLDRDPVLGWPGRRESAGGTRDAIGSRTVPAFPDPASSPALVSLYGDSFTWGSEVDDEHAWGNVLARRLGRRVNNFGVGAYGSDQAFLRYRQNTDDDAPIVVLAHLSENILRNLNRYRDLLGSSGGLGFKPRFILRADGTLELVPMPDLTPETYAACVRAPEDFLDYEVFAPGLPDGTPKLSFPFVGTIVRAFGHHHIRAKLAGRPRFMEFYADDHPARGMPLTAAILRAFVDEVHASARVPVVLLLPTGLDIAYRRAHGTWPYRPLVDRLAQDGVETLDAGPEIVRRLGDRATEELFTGGNLGAHFNAEGYEMLATIVYDHLVARGLVAKGAGDP